MREHKPTVIPFLKIIVPAVLGLVLSRVLEIPPGAALLCFLIMIATAVLLNRRPESSVYVWLCILFFFYGAGLINMPRTNLTHGERVVAAVQIEDRPAIRGRWQQTTAYIGYYRPEKGNGWVKAGERILVSIDTCYKVSPGEQMVVRGWINPVDTTGSSYGNLMRLRGLHGRMYLSPGNLLCRTAARSRTPAYGASRLHEWAAERLSRLELGERQAGVSAAMTVGDRSGIDSGLRRDYSSVGAAHILAVSGLHVGIIFLLVNIILYLLPALPRGHIWKNAAAIAAIWLYATMAGLAPSVIRAALMFSFAQVALATTSYRNALNIMLASAVIMLALNPNWAGDPSFLLSYAAVLSITMFYGPIFRFIRSRYKFLNVLTSIMLVGMLASLGTAPLVAYWFGNFPVAGWLINPLVILTAHVTVMAGIIWIIMPLGFLNPLFSGIISFSTGVQNKAVEWSAGLSWASFGVNFPLWGVVVVYVLIVGAAVLVYRKESDKNGLF